jgi:hypothetical protein
MDEFAAFLESIPNDAILSEVVDEFLKKDDGTMNTYNLLVIYVATILRSSNVYAIEHLFDHYLPIISQLNFLAMYIQKSRSIYHDTRLADRVIEYRKSTSIQIREQRRVTMRFPNNNVNNCIFVSNEELSEICSTHSIEDIKYLLDQGLQFEHCEYNLISDLIVVPQHKSMEITKELYATIEYLLENGCNINNNNFMEYPHQQTKRLPLNMCTRGLIWMFMKPHQVPAKGLESVFDKMGEFDPNRSNQQIDDLISLIKLLLQFGADPIYQSVYHLSIQELIAKYRDTPDIQSMRSGAYDSNTGTFELTFSKQKFACETDDEELHVRIYKQIHEVYEKYQRCSEECHAIVNGSVSFIKPTLLRALVKNHYHTLLYQILPFISKDQISTRNIDGSTLLDIAMVFPGSWRTLRYLFDAGADYFATNLAGRNPYLELSRFMQHVSPNYHREITLLILDILRTESESYLSTLVLDVHRYMQKFI